LGAQCCSGTRGAHDARSTFDTVKDLGQAKCSEPAAVGTSVPADIANQDAKDFIHHVAIVNMAEIAKRSGSDFDREYASAMVDGHKDLIDQLEPRIEKKTLDQWKVAITGKATAGTSVAIPPDRSDNPTTMRINQFAADIYPTVYAHLEAAKALESSLKKRDTRP
jgi:hypothetical protein